MKLVHFVRQQRQVLSFGDFETAFRSLGAGTQKAATSPILLVLSTQSEPGAWVALRCRHAFPFAERYRGKSRGFAATTSVTSDAFSPVCNTPTLTRNSSVADARAG